MCNEHGWLIVNSAGRVSGVAIGPYESPHITVESWMEIG
jgi:hypothetical protein